jgi:alkylation response protein AidB-like acyl-CoA dehydrogenase
MGAADPAGRDHRGARHKPTVRGFRPGVAANQGISVLLIPTDTPGVVRRPFASVTDRDDLDFNEVFFTDDLVPAENLVGDLNGGWGWPAVHSVTNETCCGSVMPNGYRI